MGVSIIDCPKSLKMAHEEVQKKIFAMIPERWDKLYLYASVIDHFNNLQTGEMFFYYFPKGILKKRPVNVYEVPAKFNIEENSYYSLAEELYSSIKKLRVECINNKERPWTNMTIIIEDVKYKVEYGYEALTNSQFDNNDRKIIWLYEYLNAPYESFNRKERQIINTYLSIEHEKKEKFELPMYKKAIAKDLETVRQLEKSLTYVTDEKIKEMEFKKNHIPKSQILKS